MERPKIKLQNSPKSKLLESISFLLLLLIFLHPLFIYSRLPDKIPIHYNIEGVPDSFSSAGSVWILPSIGFVLYIGLTLINRYPHLFNYPAKITPENAKRLYLFGTQTIRFTKLLTLAVFNYINYRTISYALEGNGGLGIYFLPTFLLLTFFSVFYFIYKSIKLGQQNNPYNEIRSFDGRLLLG